MLPYPDISNLSACSTEVIKTLQSWLCILHPDTFNSPVNGIYSEQLAITLAPYRQGKNSDQTWAELEKTLKGKRPPVLTEFSEDEFPDLDSRLNRIGIRYGPTEQEQAKRFAHAFIRRAHQFTRQNSAIQGPVLFPKMVEGEFDFPMRTWKNFRKTWGIFYGAPWLGMITETLPGRNPNDSFWCSSELEKVLRSWGENYLDYLSGKGKSTNELATHPIRVLYTGQRMGGPLAGFPFFSQVGLSAVLAEFDPNWISLSGISETLNAADPAWRIRMKGSGDSGYHNILFVQSNEKPVLELKPEWEKLLHHTGTFPGLMQKLGLFDNEKLLDRFVQGLQEQIEWLSADELILVLDTIHKDAPQKLISFFGKLVQTGLLFTLLKRICEEEENAVDFIGKILGTSDLLQGYVIAAEWQEKIAKLFILQDKFETIANKMRTGSFESVIKEELKNAIG